MTGTAAASEKPTFIDWLMLRTLEHRVIDGLWLGAPQKAMLDSIEESLALIRLHDPLRYRQIGRDLRRVFVLVLTSGNYAEYQRKLDASVFDERRFADTGRTALSIASTVVHEATHARLGKIGFVYSERDRVRHEAICLRRQIAFLKRVPDGERELAAAEAALDKLPEWNEGGRWSDTTFAERRETGEQAAIEYMKIPKWAVRILLGVRWCFHRYYYARSWLRTRLSAKQTK